MKISKDELLFTLKRNFGFAAFRNGQQEIIESILNKRDTLAVMPTGGGKSLCYQLPSLLLEGTTIVISPLIALMKDQVDSLNKINIPATFINSTQTKSEIIEKTSQAVAGKYKLLYIAPERLESSNFIESLMKMKISFFAIDEAHCISEWGHDFRPSYLNITKVITAFNNLPIIALTATATPEVQDDIIQSLKMKSPNRFIRGFDRQNLSYIVEDCTNKIEKIVELLKKPDGGSTIIYCGTRRRVETFGNGLNALKIPAEIYHAGLKSELKKTVQERFISDQSKIIIATNAFGMGVDKPNVRRVIHCDMTLTLEAYYQEAGRAGRDGNPSQCIILYEPDDRKLMEFFLKTSYPDVNHIEKIYNAILDLSQVQTGTKGSNFLTIDNMQLANRMNLPYMLVDSVISFLERNYIIAKNYGASNATVLFTMTQERISEYFKNTTDERRNVLEAILRCTSYQAFNKPTLINLNELNYKYDIDLESLKRCIDDFEFAGVMKLSLENGEGDYKLLIERMPLIKLPIDFDNFKFRKELAVKKLDIMQRYIETRQCKRNYILEYFKETDLSGICNRCSSCQKQEKVISKISEKEKYLYIQILKAVAQLNGRYGKTILTDILKGNPTLKIRANNLNKLSCYSSCSEFTTEQILNALWKAVKEGLINITADKYPTVYITDSGRKFLGTENIIEFQTTTSSQFHPELFEKLLKLRNELARRYSVHPEIIILNTSIRKMAELLPATEQELKEISGIGKVFINRYSNAFLHLINHYINESSGIKKRTEDLPELVQHTMQLFNESESLDTVAKKMKITQAQAASYLQQGIESGMKIRLDKIKNNKLFEKVCHLVLKSPEAPLRVIRTQIQSEINYPELRVMVAVARIEAKK